MKEHNVERKKIKGEMEKIKEKFKKEFSGNSKNEKEGSDEETP